MITSRFESSEYLSFNKDHHEFEVKKLNLFQKGLRNIFGKYKDTHSLKILEAFYLYDVVEDDQISKVIEKIKRDNISAIGKIKSDCLEIILDDWKRDVNSEGDEIKSACNRIMAASKDSQQVALDLDDRMNVSFGKLPNIFNIFSDQLTFLHLSSNELTNLPESIGSLKALTFLNLYDNKLSTLPRSFGKLTSLKSLSLSKNEFQIFPIAICALTALESLALGFNALTNLSENIGNLTSLRSLYLESNNLLTLPDTVGQITALEDLDLQENSLASIPNTISNLRFLKNVNLRLNRTLTGIPLEMLDLPSHTIIELTGCGVSNSILARIRHITRSLTYQGPRISFSILERITTEEKTVEELLHELFILTQEPVEDFNLTSNPAEKKSLRSWLSRLSGTADYQRGGQGQIHFAKQIIEYLRLAKNNELFRKVFFVVLEDASKTCGDRVSLSVMHIDIQYKLTTFNLYQFQELSEFLKGVWAVNMLEEIALKKIPTLPFFDEIEVYLGYPIKLKKSLQLPINISHMLYFNCSCLKDSDLKDAENLVKNKQQNKEAFYQYLITQDKWVEALTLKFPNEMQVITQARSDHADAMVGLRDYKQQLLHLTERTDL